MISALYAGSSNQTVNPTEIGTETIANGCKPFLTTSSRGNEAAARQAASVSPPPRTHSTTGRASRQALAMT